MKEGEEFLVVVRNFPVVAFVHSHCRLIDGMYSHNVLFFAMAKEKVVHARKVEKRVNKINSDNDRKGECQWTPEHRRSSLALRLKDDMERIESA